LIQALTIGQAAVQQGHPPTEAPAELQGYRMGEGDFGKEHQHLPAGGQGFLGRSQIHLGLAAGRHPVEEIRREGLSPYAFGQGPHRLFLLGDQSGEGLLQGQGMVHQGVSEGKPLLPGNQPAPGQALQDGETRGKDLAQFRDRHRLLSLPEVSQNFPAPGSHPLGGHLSLCLGFKGHPPLPFRPGGPGAPGDEVAQGLSQGIAVVLRHPAPQRDNLRPEAGQGVQHRQNFSDSSLGDFSGRSQKVACHLTPPHRHLHQAAHPGRVFKHRGEAVGQGLEKRQGHRHFPQVADLGPGLGDLG